RDSRRDATAPRIEHADAVGVDRRRRGCAAAREGNRQRDPEQDGKSETCAHQYAPATPGCGHFADCLLRCFDELPLAPGGARRRRRLERRELVVEPRRNELEDVLRLVHVLELVLAEVAQRDVRRWIVAQQLARRLGDEHLSPVTRPGYPRRAVDAKADVTLAAV